MKKILFLIITAFVLIACDQQTCQSDNDAVCEIESIEDFEIENDAQIIIGVFDEQYGKEIVEALDKNFEGVYSYELIDSENINDIDGLDIIQTKVENVPLMFEHLQPISDNFNHFLENEYLTRFSNDVNQSEHYFMPLEIKGLLFAYNATMLEELGVNLEDVDADGLPEAINSFEKIGELANGWKSNEATYLNDPLEKVFSFPFNDQLSMISFIENSDYKLIGGVSGESLNTEQSLTNALNQFQKLGSYPWYFDEEEMTEMKWDYEQSLTNQSAPFMLIGNWMFYEQYQKSEAYDLVFARLPQINEADISTLSNVSGFVLNKDSKFPNAQNQFLKFVKDKKGVEVAISVGEIPIIDPLLIDDLDIEVSPNVAQQIKAYTYSKSIDLQAFDKDPSIIAYNIYYDVDFRDIWKDVFFDEMSVEDAQKEMINRIRQWLVEHNLEVEGITDDVEDNHTERTE